MAQHLESVQFAAVDQTVDPAFFVRFMDEGHAMPSIQASKALMRQRLDLRPGDAVLDVGCGPATSLLEMATTVGAEGRLVGLDASATMIAEARCRAAGLCASVTFEVGDAQTLPYEDEKFDVCHAERLLMHVQNAERTLAELVRVARPGGHIGVFDFDWDTLIVDSPDKATTRTIVQTFSDALQYGWKEGSCRRWHAHAGAGSPVVGATARGKRPGVFRLGVTAFIVAGAKPGGGSRSSPEDGAPEPSGSSCLTAAVDASGRRFRYHVVRCELNRGLPPPGMGPRCTYGDHVDVCRLVSTSSARVCGHA